MSWTAVPPEIATTAMAAFDQCKHKVLATLRADGSPRVSGSEVEHHSDGELYLGSMPDALKARDLQRDPRFALHSAPVDVDLKDVPDVKIAGTAVEITTPEELAAYRSGKQIPPGDFHLFRLEVTEVVCTRVEGDQLVVESWHPERGVQVVRRT
jgi:hypothetical protein